MPPIELLSHVDYLHGHLGNGAKLHQLAPCDPPEGSPTDGQSLGCDQDSEWADSYGTLETRHLFLPLVRRRTYHGEAKCGSFGSARTPSQSDLTAAAGGVGGVSSSGRPPLPLPLPVQHSSNPGSLQRHHLEAAFDGAASAAAAAYPGHAGPCGAAGAAPSRPTLANMSPGSQTHAKNLTVMHLHRKSLLDDLVTSVVHLLERHAHGPNTGLRSSTSSGASGVGAALAQDARRTIKAHFQCLPNRYALSVEPADVLVHVKLMAAARRGTTPQAHISRKGGGGLALVVVACRDSLDLLDAITRVLRGVSRRIRDADVMTSDDGIALDRFEVELEPGRGVDQDPALVRHIQASLSAEATKDHQQHPPCPMPLPPSRDCCTDCDDASGAAARVSWYDASAASAADPHSLSLHVTSDGSTICEWSPSTSEGSSSSDGGSGGGGGGNGGGGDAPPPTPLEPPAADGEIPFSELALAEVVGRGRFSRMHRALWRGSVVAVKLVEPPSAAEHARERDLILGEFARELDVVARLRHAHVCRFLGASRSGAVHALVFEYLGGGNLAEHLRARAAAPADARQALRLASQIADGMQYLHAQGVLHRDLKSANVLLDARGDARIVDFGLSCFSAPGMDLTAETGTYRWMAPEVIRHEPYSAAADVYSYGIVLWELLARAQPFEGLTPIQAAFAVARRGLRPPLPPGTPAPLAALVRRCWAADPAQRPTFENVFEDALPAVRAALGLRDRNRPPV